MSSRNSELKICAIGLDHFGFRLRPKMIDMPDCRIDLLSKDEVLASNLDYDGLIIPSGIFERFASIPDRDGARMSVQSDPDVLKKMEAKITHQLDRGKWVCFLVDEIVDRINEDHPKIRATIVNDTDLCKRIMNKFGLQRNSPQTIGSLEVKTPAFLNYVQKYATPKTVLSPPKDLSVRELVTSSSGSLGISVANQLFFLPFFKNFSRSQEISLPVVDIVKSIPSFLENPNARLEAEEEIPSWAEAFSFTSEETIKREQEDLKKKLDQLKIDLSFYRKFKSLLTQTSESLKETVKLVFTEYFKIKVIEEGKGFKIDDGLGNILGVAIVESCSGGIQRSMINDIDNYREALRLPHSSLGVLIVNDHLEANSLTEKQEARIESEILEHSKRQNSILLRSVDLLQLMKKWETLSETERKKEFLLYLQKPETEAVKLEVLTKAAKS